VGGLDRRQGARRKVPDEDSGDRRGRDATERNHGRAAPEKGTGAREGAGSTPGAQERAARRERRRW
jgi:hypothetical protein